MNTVLSNYGQLCDCPEILKKSCKFFCRGLDIRVPHIVDAYIGVPGRFQIMVEKSVHMAYNMLNRTAGR